jgi:hypothetical protein
MFKKLILATIASLVMLPALAAKPPDKPDKGNKGGGAVPLDVVFNNDSILYKFRDDLGGDGGGSQPYLDGFEGVEAQIDKFRFKLNVGLNGSRYFRLDLSDCISSGTCESPTLYSKGWNVFATSPDGAQYLTMNKDDSKPVNFSLVFFDDLEQQWSIKFNPGECPDGVGLASRATVTKTSDDPDTWTFTAGTSDVACLYNVEGPRKNHSFNGLYVVPFEITAVVQP